MEFQALPSRIGQIRRILSAQLRYWRLDPLIDAAALGVTELLANVHRHANSGDGSSGDGASGVGGADKHCTVEITYVWNRLTVAVHDHDPRLPSVRSGSRAAGAPQAVEAAKAAAAAEAAKDPVAALSGDGVAMSGRGLALVAAVSESWGMRALPNGSGKTVWFSLPAAFSTPRSRPAPSPDVYAAEPAAETPSAGPVETAPVETAPVETAPLGTPAAAPEEAVPVEAAAAAPVERQPRTPSVV